MINRNLRFALLAITCIVIFFIFLAASTSTQHGIRTLQYCRAVMATLFVGLTLLAIRSKGRAPFSIGFCVTFVSIIFLKAAYKFDPVMLPHEFINDSLNLFVRFNNGSTQFFAQREFAFLLCCVSGGLLLSLNNIIAIITAWRDEMLLEESKS